MAESGERKSSLEVPGVAKKQSQTDSIGSDARRQVDGIVMVMNAGKTRMDSAIQATHSLRKVNCHILGAVLNRLERSTRGYYYYYDGYYTSDDVDDDSSDKPKRSRTSRKGGSSSPKSALEGTVNLARPEK